MPRFRNAASRTVEPVFLLGDCWPTFTTPAPSTIMHRPSSLTPRRRLGSLPPMPSKTSRRPAGRLEPSRADRWHRLGHNVMLTVHCPSAGKTCQRHPQRREGFMVGRACGDHPSPGRRVWRLQGAAHRLPSKALPSRSGQPMGVSTGIRPFRTLYGKPRLGS